MKALKISLIALLACTALISCKKDDETTDDTATKKANYVEYLTNKKGWVLESATTSPAYALSNGTFCTDLMTEGYLEECELDDVIKFTENGGMTINPGENLCESGYTEEVAATWALSEDLNKITIQIPFFYNNEGTSYNQQTETCDILSLTKDQLRIKYTFNDDPVTSKGDYSFTLTYKINK